MDRYLGIPYLLIRNKNVSWPERAIISFLVSIQLYPEGYLPTLNGLKSVLNVGDSDIESLESRKVLKRTGENTYRVNYARIIEDGYVGPDTAEKLRASFEKEKNQKKKII